MSLNETGTSHILDVMHQIGLNIDKIDQSNVVDTLNLVWDYYDTKAQEYSEDVEKLTINKEREKVIEYIKNLIVNNFSENTTDQNLDSIDQNWAWVDQDHNSKEDNKELEVICKDHSYFPEEIRSDLLKGDLDFLNILKETLIDLGYTWRYSQLFQKGIRIKYKHYHLIWLNAPHFMNHILSYVLFEKPWRAKNILDWLFDEEIQKAYSFQDIKFVDTTKMEQVSDLSSFAGLDTKNLHKDAVFKANLKSALILNWTIFGHGRTSRLLLWYKDQYIYRKNTSGFLQLLSKYIFGSRDFEKSILRWLRWEDLKLLQKEIDQERKLQKKSSVVMLEDSVVDEFCDLLEYKQDIVDAYEALALPVSDPWLVLVNDSNTFIHICVDNDKKMHAYVLHCYCDIETQKIGFAKWLVLDEEVLIELIDSPETNETRSIAQVNYIKHIFS